MNDNYLYLILNLAAISVPLAMSFHPRSMFYKTWFAQVPAMLLVAALFITWDIVFTKMGVWGFNPRYLTGINLINLPIEEWMFFITIPYACVFSYHSIKVLTKDNFAQKTQPYVTLVLLIGLTLVVSLSGFKWYTSITFFALLVLVAFLSFILRKSYLARFYFTYMLMLFPFFIINGILTGTGIEGEVVWYNNSENLGLRIGTIPIEDTFYGMLLILMNVTFYEYFLYLGKSNDANWKSEKGKHFILRLFSIS